MTEIHDRLEELMHLAVDGFATEAQNAELRELLESNASARERFENLRTLVRHLAMSPECEPVGDLAESVLTAIRADPATGSGARSAAGVVSAATVSGDGESPEPRRRSPDGAFSRGGQSSRGKWWSKWAGSKWRGRLAWRPSIGLATGFAVGVFAAVFLMRVTAWNDTMGDSFPMGTILQDSPRQLSRTVRRELDLASVGGWVEVRVGPALGAVDLRLDTDHPVDLEIRFDPRMLVATGFQHETRQIRDPGASTAPGERSGPDVRSEHAQFAVSRAIGGRYRFLFRAGAELSSGGLAAVSPEVVVLLRDPETGLEESIRLPVRIGSGPGDVSLFRPGSFSPTPATPDSYGLHERCSWSDPGGFHPPAQEVPS